MTAKQAKPVSRGSPRTSRSFGHGAVKRHTMEGQLPKQGFSQERIGEGFFDPHKSLVSNCYDPQHGYLVIGRVADGLGLSKTQLAETVGIDREALYKESRQKAPKTQTRVREMLEIVDRVKDWAGGKEQAVAWYRSQPIPAFGGRTAESLVKDNKAGALRDYLDHLAMGGFA